MTSNLQVDSMDLVAEIFLRTNIIRITNLLLEDVIFLIKVDILITVIFTACTHKTLVKTMLSWLPRTYQITAASTKTTSCLVQLAVMYKDTAHPVLDGQILGCF